MSSFKKAIVLAAGKGTRLHPLTQEIPKPLIKVGGHALIDYSLQHLKNAGIQDIIINIHYKAQQILDHFKDENHLTFSCEEIPLESGGGIKNALPFFEGKPFFALNADIIFIDPAKNLLKKMQEAWDPSRMDILLCLISLKEAKGYSGKGDFSAPFLSKNPFKEAFVLKKDPAALSYIYGGIQIYKPELFANYPETIFKPTQLYENALKANKLYGLIHEGPWLHIGTPEELENAHQWFKTNPTEEIWT